MNPARLLDPERLGVLQTLLQTRLQQQLSSAPAHGLLSITLDLGTGEDRWLTADFEQSNAVYWAQPKHAHYRLALGRAMLFTTAGPARFSALQAAFAGLAPVWQHDDSEHTGVSPAAHIGFAFEDESGQSAGELPNARLLVPAILLQNKAGQCTATFSCAVRDAENAIENWREELRLASIPGTNPHGTGQRIDLTRQPAPLAERAFLARAHAALAGIAAGHLEKIVLTRSVRFDAERPISVKALLATLQQNHPECTTYALGHHGQCFAGATPERLVALQNGMVRADALAGTAWLTTAANLTQPGSLELQDDKNSREQQLVVDAVRTALAPLCLSLDPPQAPEIMQLRGLQHLRTDVTGIVGKAVGLFDLIARLHPTPAVGGTPGLAARQWLRAHGDQRGAWYTGGVGWIDRQGDGEVAVALRCARIAGVQAELFAGAGIVAGSNPAQELAETEIKLGAIIDALQQPLQQPIAAADSTDCAGSERIDRTGTR
jgi:isochorismate synthase